VLFGTGAPCCGYPNVMVLDPSTGDSLAGTVGQGFRVTSPVPVPASGQLAIGVYQPPAVPFRECYDATCGALYTFTGSYSFQALPFNRGPETTSATYRLGDTVSTEALTPAGDVDEFILIATPGATLLPFFRLLAAPRPAGSLIGMEVLDSATGIVLTGTGVYLTGVTPTFFSPGAFVVPASGKVLLRFRGTGTFGDAIGTAPYAFYVTRAP